MDYEEKKYERRLNDSEVANKSYYTMYLDDFVLNWKYYFHSWCFLLQSLRIEFHYG